MNRTWKHLLGCTAALASFQAAGQVRLYEHDNFLGRSFTADGALGDFTRAGFNDRASSVVVRGGRWILCDDSRFGGNCVRLRPGRYASNDRVSSARPDDGSDHGGRYRDRDRDGYVDGRHRTATATATWTAATATAMAGGGTATVGISTATTGIGAPTRAATSKA